MNIFYPFESKYKDLQRQKERTRISDSVLIIIHSSTQDDMKEIVELNRDCLFESVTTTPYILNLRGRKPVVFGRRARTRFVGMSL